MGKLVDGFATNIQMPPPPMVNRQIDDEAMCNATIYEYAGCYTHKCKSCTNHDDYDPQRQKFNREIYNATMQKNQFFRDHGYNVIEIWECEFKKELKHNNEWQAILHSDKLTYDPIIVNSSMVKGGRVQRMCLEAEANENWELLSFDFVRCVLCVYYYC